MKIIVYQMPLSKDILNIDICECIFLNFQTFDFLNHLFVFLYIYFSCLDHIFIRNKISHFFNEKINEKLTSNNKLLSFDSKIWTFQAVGKIDSPSSKTGRINSVF